MFIQPLTYFDIRVEGFPQFGLFNFQESEGLPLPHWAKAVYPEPLAKYVYKAHLVRSAASDLMTRLLIGKIFFRMKYFIINTNFQTCPAFDISMKTKDTFFYVL